MSIDTNPPTAEPLWQERPALAATAPASMAPVGRRRRKSARTTIRPRHDWQSLNLGELWRTRELLWIFATRDVKVRYKQTFFGLAWAVVVPLVQVAVFTVFFGGALGVSERVDAAAGQELPYALFALTGLIAWNVFKMSLDGASASLLTHANIVRKIYLPRLVLPLAALGKPAVDTVVTWLLMLAIAGWYAGAAGSTVNLSGALTFSPILLAASAVAGLAIGLIVAAITVSYRDLQHVMPFLTSILFFVTPVIYSIELLPPKLAWLLYMNPVVGFVQAHRAVVMGLPVDWIGVAVSSTLTVAVLIFGLFYFTRAERQFADVG